MAVADWATIGTTVTYDMKDVISNFAEIEGLTTSGLLKKALASYALRRAEESLTESKELGAAADDSAAPLVAKMGFYGAAVKRTDKTEALLNISKELGTMST